MTKGFSIIEISLVVLIIALLISGIMIGAEMINQTQLRRMITDAERYILAVEAYRLKYSALPGDSPNASAFFPGCAVDTILVGNTCSGDGNGKMMYVDGSLREGWRAFEHLHLSGMFTNQLSELGLRPASAANNDATLAGLNAPEGIISGSVYNFGSTLATRAATYRLGIGKETGVWVADAALFTHSEAYYIDNKVDDGFPHSGHWTTWGNATCYGDGAQNTAYNFSIEDVDCSIAYQDIKIR